MTMLANVGVTDRALRGLVGLLLIAAPLGLYGADYVSLWGWIGLIPLVTAIVGWCPAYSLLGLKT